MFCIRLFSPRLWFLALMCAAGLGATVFGAAPHPRLLFGLEEIPSWTSRLATPIGQAMQSRLDRLMEKEWVEGDVRGNRAAGYALRYRLTRDGVWATRSLEAVEAVLAAVGGVPPLVSGANNGQPEVSPVYLAQVVNVALAYDWCGERWPAERRAAVVTALEVAARRSVLIQERGRSGKSPMRMSMVLWKATGGLAALAVAEDAGAGADCGAMARGAAAVLRRYLDSGGNQGWPREGFAAVRTMLGEAPSLFMQAWRRREGDDLLAGTAARGWVNLYAIMLVAPQPKVRNDGPQIPFWGSRGWLKGSSRGDGQERAPVWSCSPNCGGDFARLLLLADAASRSALQKSFDQCFGVLGDRTCDIRHPVDFVFAVMGYPFAEAAIDPDTVFPHVWRDDRAGVVIQRPDWDGPADVVAGISGNGQPAVGLPSYADAGSFRLLAMGGRWAVQRQAERGDVDTVHRERENVVIVPGTHGWFGGSLLPAQYQPDGSGMAVFNLDAAYLVAPADGKPQRLENTADLGMRVQRTWSVDFSGACGAPVLAVVVDKLTPGPSRRWQMHTEERDIKVLSDGFLLKSAQGATLRLTVVAPAKPKLRIDKGLWTDTLAIDGDADFFVVMTVQPAGAEAPSVQWTGAGLDARVKVGGTSLYFDGRWVGMQ